MESPAPAPITKEFEEVQDSYLQKVNADRGIVSLSGLTETEPGIYLWQGDITRLAVDGIVNAANSGIEVIFNVWKDIDYEIYRKLLG